MNKNVSSIINGYDRLLISFGGIREGMGMPVYEFYNSLKDLECDKIFIKDINQAWYHKGINEDINNIKDLYNYLQKIINENSYKKVVFIGNSMGAYASILFGTLLNIDSVIAFSPQTFISKLKRIITRDKRWRNQISRIYKYNKAQKEYFDLKHHLKNCSYKTVIYVFYSNIDRLDLKHSNNIKGLNNVELNPYSYGGHNLIKYLRDNGSLKEIVKKSLDS